MSGGSFNYLYGKHLELGYGDSQDLEEMVRVLEQRHAGSRAAINARALLEGMKNLSGLMRTLQDVFKAVEWVHSGDCLEHEIDDAVEEYEAKR